MQGEGQKEIRWDFYSLLIIACFVLFQAMRWRVLPQFMDIYYHILTAQGFIRAGGYSGWDFWQYAPLGRTHIYPPFFHFVLALLIGIKSGPVIIAKIFEAASIPGFMFVLWLFLKRNFDSRLAFFSLLAFGSSFTFSLSLINHIPVTLALIFGMFSLERIFRRQAVRAALLLALAFYTHIGTSWFLALAILFYACLDTQTRRACAFTLFWGLVFSAPMIAKQIASLGSVSSLGLNLNESNLCQIKIIDYLPAIAGALIAFKKGARYRFIFSLLPASLIYVVYPYRFFSQEGYLPIFLLGACFLAYIYDRLSQIKYRRLIFILVAVFILLISPTLSMDKAGPGEKVTYGVKVTDSAFLGLLLARGGSIWFPQDYFPAVSLIRGNSGEDDIVFCSINALGPALAGLSGRFTANALLPEIGPASGDYDPIAASKIAVFALDEDPSALSKAVIRYDLREFGRTKLFALFKNQKCRSQAVIRRASVPFWAAGALGLVFGLVFWLAKGRKK
ncbi:MAG: hypothetical protein FJZ09_03350 [Candidatus Omnitrophica bacterium]|nr:hypothetical protein [Candidatus Omnitrophota bacterium]